jgi:ketosteroid isomerase-like protein
MKTKSAMSRRYLLAAAAGSMAIACGGATPAPSSGAAPPAARQQDVIRNWYAAWEKKDWGSVDAMTADNFTFSSAAGDDHISKSTYKTQCWDTQSARIDRFDLESVLGNGNEAFVKYVCRTKNGKAFENVEHFTFKGDKIVAIECYFGGQAGYPSAADRGNG